MAYLVRVLIRGYQFFIAPLLGSNCKFYPTCSQYALEAFETQSFFRAFWKVVKRLGRCNPWHPGGVDLVKEQDIPLHPDQR